MVRRGAAARRLPSASAVAAGDLPQHQLLFQSPETVNEEFLVEMVGLVAEGPREESRGLDRPPAPRRIRRFDDDRRGAGERLGEPGNRQAAFVRTDFSLL